MLRRCEPCSDNVRRDVYTYSIGRAQKNGQNKSGEAANYPYHGPASVGLQSTSNHSETQRSSPGMGHRSVIPTQEERKELGRIILYPWVTLSHKCLKTELWAQREKSKDVSRREKGRKEDKRIVIWSETEANQPRAETYAISNCRWVAFQIVEQEEGYGSSDGYESRSPR